MIEVVDIPIACNGNGLRSETLARELRETSPPRSGDCATGVERLLTLRDVREAAQVSRWAVWTWIRDGRLRAVKIGSVSRIRIQDWELFLQRHATPAEVTPRNNGETPS